MKYESTTIGRCLTHNKLVGLDQLNIEGPFIKVSQFNNTQFNGKAWHDAVMIANSQRTKYSAQVSFVNDRSRLSDGELIYGQIDGKCVLLESIIDSSD
jgi:hypothetical protein